MSSASLVLPPIGALYGAAIRLRLQAYRRGVLNTARLAAPVISVGNITVGGTGKTPLVEWFCRALAKEGRKPCVLTRGYRRAQPNTRVLVSNAKSVKATASEAGDEAFLLARNLKGIAAVVSDANRTDAGNWALKELGVDAFVLDDGFQHLQLARDLNVLVIDASDPWGGNKLLPMGRLREPLSGLSRADCILVTRVDNARKSETLLAELGRLVKCPILTSEMQTARITTLAGKEIAVESIAKPIAAFCGVGNPESFFSHVRSLGLNLLDASNFPDHHNFQQQDIQRVTQQARAAGATALITTQKDEVKLTKLHFDLPCYVLEIRIAIHQEAEMLSLMRKALSEQAKPYNPAGD